MIIYILYLSLFWLFCHFTGWVRRWL